MVQSLANSPHPSIFQRWHKAHYLGKMPMMTLITHDSTNINAHVCAQWRCVMRLARSERASGGGNELERVDPCWSSRAVLRRPGFSGTCTREFLFPLHNREPPRLVGEMPSHSCVWKEGGASDAKSTRSMQSSNVCGSVTRETWSHYVSIVCTCTP